MAAARDIEGRLKAEPMNADITGWAKFKYDWFGIPPQREIQVLKVNDNGYKLVKDTATERKFIMGPDGGLVQYFHDQDAHYFED